MRNSTLPDDLVFPGETFLIQLVDAATCAEARETLAAMFSPRVAMAAILRKGTLRAVSPHHSCGPWAASPGGFRCFLPQGVPCYA